jgi:hypothetical protein
MLRALQLTCAVCALAVVPAAPARDSSGLHGVVTRGPTTPVCLVGVPCTEPAAGILLTFTRPGAPARSVRTGTRGGYRIRLAPGAYSVRTSAAPFGRIPKPARVRVPRGRFARVDLSIDTGIR